jgi:WD40 repeat protein
MAQGTKFLAGTGDNMLKLYNVPFDFESKGALLTRFEVATTAVAYSPCETLVAAGSRDGTIKVVSPDDQSNFKRVKAHNGVVKSLSFDPARKYLVRVSYNQSDSSIAMKRSRSQLTFIVYCVHALSGFVR